MNILTQSELANKAKELFIKFPNMQSVTALGDGQFFDDAAGGSSSVNLDETASEFKTALKLYKGQLNG